MIITSIFRVVFIFILCALQVGLAQGEEPSGTSMDSLQALIFKAPDLARNRLESLEGRLGRMSSSEKYDYYRLYGILESVSGEADVALMYFEQGMQFAQTDSQRISSLVDQSIIQNGLNNNKAALDLLDNAENLCANLENANPLIRIHSSRASVYKNMGYLNLSVQESLAAITQIKATHNKPYDLNIERQKLGNTYLELKDYQFAIAEFEAILPYFKSQSDIYTSAIVNLSLAEAMAGIKDYRSALRVIDRAITGFKTVSNQPLLCLSWSVKADIQEGLNVSRQDIQSLHKKALNKYTVKKTPYGLHVLYGYLDFLLRNELHQDYNNVFKENQSFLKEQATALDDKHHYYTLLKAYHKINQDFSHVVSVTDSLLLLKDKLMKQQLDNRLSELQVKYKTDAIEAENKLYATKQLVLKDQVVHQKNQVNLLLLVSIIVVFVFAFTINHSITKRKGMELEIVALNDKNRESKRNLELKTALLEQNKMDMLKISEQEYKLKKFIEALKKHLNENNLQAAQNLVDAFTVNKNPWKLTIEKFKKFDSQFIKKLKSKHPKLSKSDIEFCILVKMNMSNTEIAQILNIATNSVFMKKYRVVKKMKLEKSIDFFNYLQSF